MSKFNDIKKQINAKRTQWINASISADRKRPNDIFPAFMTMVDLEINIMSRIKFKRPIL